MSADSEAGLRVDPTGLAGVLLVKPDIYRDNRGSFRELFKISAFEAATDVVRRWPQDNHSSSSGGVLRGVHYQLDPPQGKLVSCSVGEIYDVAVDLRRSSDTFGGWVGHTLSEDNGHQLWIPEGFGHGYLVLSETADVFYKVTAEHSASGYHAVAWDDPDLGIEWPLQSAPVVSDRDRNAPGLGGANLFA